MKGGYCDEGSEATPGSPKNKQTEDGMNNVFTEVVSPARNKESHHPTNKSVLVVRTCYMHNSTLTTVPTLTTLC